jgi:uncharacterized membrane protein YdjX (TVP38/TMEM64 family)
MLTLGAGFLFGLAWGFLLASAASTIGATCAFIISRYFARDWVTHAVADDGRFRTIDAAVGQQGWKLVVLTRLSPILPFTLVNYAFGLTGVPLRHYVLASWLGMIPSTLLYVYFGSVAGSLGRLGGSSRWPRERLEWVLYGIGLAATVTVVALIVQIIRKARGEARWRNGNS